MSFSIFQLFIPYQEGCWSKRNAGRGTKKIEAPVIMNEVSDLCGLFTAKKGTLLFFLCCVTLTNFEHFQAIYSIQNT